MDQSEFRIEPAVMEDVPVIRQIMEQCVAALPEREWFIDDNEEFITAHIEQNGYTLKCTAGDRIAGYLIVHEPGETPGNLGTHLNFSREELRQVRHLESACVLPEYRGMHIQEMLMTAAMQKEMKNPGTRYLMCTVHPDNVFSKRNIEKLGLSAVRQIEEYGWPRLIMLRNLRDTQHPGGEA